VRPCAESLVVVAGLIVRDGHVLACQRRFEGRHPGKWEFPGGKVEPGESLAEALRRELMEELSIDAQIGALLFQTSHRYAGEARVHLSFLRVDDYAGTVRNLAFAEVRWVLPADLGGLDFLAGDYELITALHQGRLSLS
jgi:8-oxo-dGTP diphosphatase